MGSRLGKGDLLDRFCGHLVADGRTEVLTRPGRKAALRLPWVIAVRLDGARKRRIQVYCWNVTHGGASRSDHEYRVQITTGIDRTVDFSKSRVLLLGYLSVSPGDRLAELLVGLDTVWEAYVAWNPAMHRGARGSASCQVDAAALVEAWRFGESQTSRLLRSGLRERVCVTSAGRVSTFVKDLTWL